MVAKRKERWRERVSGSVAVFWVGWTRVKRRTLSVPPHHKSDQNLVKKYVKTDSRPPTIYLGCHFGTWFEFVPTETDADRANGGNVGVGYNL